MPTELMLFDKAEPIVDEAMGFIVSFRKRLCIPDLTRPKSSVK
jgi:hypothetical protein